VGFQIGNYLPIETASCAARISNLAAAPDVSAEI